MTGENDGGKGGGDCNTAGGRGSASFAAASQRKLMTAQCWHRPSPHVSSELPARPPKEASGPGNRSAERKRGMLECGFCLRCVDWEYL